MVVSTQYARPLFERLRISPRHTVPEAMVLHRSLKNAGG